LSIKLANCVLNIFSEFDHLCRIYDTIFNKETR
jgi:hypothetical protein